MPSHTNIPTNSPQGGDARARRPTYAGPNSIFLSIVLKHVGNGGSPSSPHVVNGPSLLIVKGHVDPFSPFKQRGAVSTKGGIDVTLSLQKEILKK